MRPTLDEISKKLENLSENTTDEFVKNCINKNNQQTVQSILNYSERLDSSNNITENITWISITKVIKMVQKNNTHSKNDAIDELSELNETTSNNNFVALNEVMNLFTRSSNGSEEMFGILYGYSVLYSTI
ncbi:24028_t:CDS:2 [Dentiscutata erythropus]|uniref:24028_t:CDS:1 n=1 Tax=Dentiscutata erythropus TaxID=1348616 RepID=A0A9N8WEJ8_9GLOM|nr:24028_t:CDS:2 [Dentiscutata erythropus]